MGINPVYLGIVSEEQDGTWEYSAMEIMSIDIDVVPGRLLHENSIQLTITLEPGEKIMKEWIDESYDDD